MEFKHNQLMWSGRGIVVLGAFAACGPSAKDVERAKTASYQCPYEQVFQAAVDEVKDRASPLAGVDAGEGIVQSEFRWHSRDGSRKQAGAAMVTADDVMFAVAVVVQKRGEAWGVVAEPRVVSQTAGGPRGSELTRDHADWPQWADTKTEAIITGIYERLKGCAVAGFVVEPRSVASRR
jgi:hypothetical protein